MIKFNIHDYTLEVYEKYDQVKDIWPKLIGENNALKSANLLPLEMAKVPNISPYYLIVSKSGKKVGVIYYQMLHFNASFIDLGILNKWYYNILQFFIRRIKTNLLICGSLFRIGFKGFAGIEASNVAEITKRIAENGLLEKKICGVLIKDLTEKLDIRTQSKFKYRQMSSDVTMEMPLRPNWVTMEDYIQDLTRKYKKRAKSIIKAGEQIEIRELSVDEVSKHKVKMHQLYQQIVSRQIVRLGILNVDYFIETKKLLGDNYKLFGFFEQEKLVAFTTHIYYKEEMEISYIGFDYQSNNRYQLYFNILFHGLEYAIAGQYKKLELGRTAKEAKASMGAEPIENINFYCINNPFLNGLFNKIRSNFEEKMGENWANRQPLK